MLPRKNTTFSGIYKDQIGIEPDIYMYRTQVFAVRIFNMIFQLRINKIMREDRDPNPHTHPFPFISFIWKGSYLEQLYDSKGHAVGDLKHRRRFSIGYRSKSCVHNIVKLIEDKPVTTFFFSWLNVNDPQYGVWGFIKDEKFIDSDTYLGRKEQEGRRTKVRT